MNNIAVPDENKQHLLLKRVSFADKLGSFCPTLPALLGTQSKSTDSKTQSNVLHCVDQQSDR